MHPESPRIYLPDRWCPVGVGTKERQSRCGLSGAPECPHFPSVRGNCSKPKNGVFTGALRLRKLVHALSLPIIWWQEGGHRLNPLPRSPAYRPITVSTLYALNLVGILVAYLGRSAIKLSSSVLLISAVRLVGNCHFDNSLC